MMFSYDTFISCNDCKHTKKFQSIIKERVNNTKSAKRKAFSPAIRRGREILADSPRKAGRAAFAHLVPTSPRKEGSKRKEYPEATQESLRGQTRQATKMQHTVCKVAASRLQSCCKQVAELLQASCRDGASQLQRFHSFLFVMSGSNAVGQGCKRSERKADTCRCPTVCRASFKQVSAFRPGQIAFRKWAGQFPPPPAFSLPLTSSLVMVRAAFFTLAVSSPMR